MAQIPLGSSRHVASRHDKCLTMSGFVSATCRAGFFPDCANCVQSFVRWRLMQLRQSYVLLSRAVLATVTVYCTALPTHCSRVCNPCRMLPPAWLRAHVDETTSPRCWGTFIGCRYDVASTLNWLC